MTNTTEPTPLDGIAATPDPPISTVPEVSQQVTRKKATMNLSLVALIVGIAYSVPGLFSLAVSGSPDPALRGVKSLFTTVYGIGGGIWLLLALFGFMRIQSIKDHPRMKLRAMLRLGAFTLPLIFVSAGVAIMVNISPRLTLEILSPKTAEELVAPTPVTLGMQTALTYFKSTGLTPLKYEWDFNGDGTIDQESFDPSASYIFLKSGVFAPAARVTMTDGQTKKLTRRLVIPRASFSVLPPNPIVDEPAAFSLEHLFPKSAAQEAPKLSKALWDFDGDGTVDEETDKMTASFVFRKLGQVTPTVKLVLTNQSESTLQRTLTVVKAPEQPFPVSIDTEPTTLLGPPPFGALFTLKTKEPIANASWDFGNGKTADGLRVAQVFSSVGTYSVQATVRSESGSVARITKVVRVTNPLQIPDLTFTGTPDVRNFSIDGEVPLSINITPVTSQPLISFTWDIPQGQGEFEVTERTLTAVYRDEGKYFIDLIGVDPDQNVFRKRISILAKSPSSFVSFSMDPSAPTAPALVKFDGSDTFVKDEEITGFEWDFGDGTSSDSKKFSGARIDHVFEKSGTYVITLTVRTTTGNTYADKKTLVVRAPVIDACFIPSRKSGKAPLGVRFDTDCSTGQFSSWLWDFGDGSQSSERNPTHVYTKNGEFTVTLTATTKDGLRSSKTTIISVLPE